MPLKISRVLRYALEDMIDLESSSEQRRLIIESIPHAPPVLSRALPVASAAVSSTDGLLDTLARPPSIQLDEQTRVVERYGLLLVDSIRTSAAVRTEVGDTSVISVGLGGGGFFWRLKARSNISFPFYLSTRAWAKISSATSRTPLLLLELV